MGPDAFDYALPPERIAQRPAQRRGDSRLLVLGPSIVHAHARDLARFLPDDALVVVNDSRVVPARIQVSREDGRTFELLVTEPRPDMGPGTELTAWVRGARKLRPDDRLAVGELVLRYQGTDAVDPRARRFLVEAGDAFRALGRHGQVPLPPYIQRPEGPDESDAQRYQTTYAAAPGSVAAPTAGLHLDEALVDQLDVVRLTLHVGPGTFLPMEGEDVTAHRVGRERYHISEEAAARIQAARRAGRPVVAVGTTSTRTLEGVAAAHGGDVVAGEGATDLVITPGHRFRVVSALLTNFHLPRSSLLMLTCSLGGRERVLAAYDEAVRREYRFYSYGDCMLLFPEEASGG